MTVTVNSVQVDFHLDPPLVTFLQGADMDVTAIRDTLREIEESEEGREFPTYFQGRGVLCSASGNEDFTEALDGSMMNAITVRVLAPFVCGFEAGASAFSTSNGNLLFSSVDSPGAIVKINNAVGSVLLNSPQIEYGSFAGGVTIDVTSSYSGTEFPVGTPLQPVNNLADAMTIKGERGLRNIYVVGDLTVDSGASYEGTVFVGESKTKSALSVSSPANTYRCEFYEATMGGALDGNAVVNHCAIGDLDYIDGFIESCILLPGSTTTLSGVATAIYTGCVCAATAWADLPVIDCGGSGSALVIRGYDGCIRIRNKTGPEGITIDLVSGTAVFETATVTQGTIRVAGTGQILDENGDPITESWNANVTLELGQLTSPQSVADAVLREQVGDHSGVSGSLAESVSWLRKMATNRIEEAPGDPGTLIVYDDDAVTPLFTFQIQDYLGSAVGAVPGSPARRTAAT